MENNFKRAASLTLLAITVFGISAMAAHASFMAPNKVDRYIEVSDGYANWEIDKEQMLSTIHKQDMKWKNDLVYSHCEAIYQKLGRNEPIQNEDFVAPCTENNSTLYFQVRLGLAQHE